MLHSWGTNMPLQQRRQEPAGVLTLPADMILVATPKSVKVSVRGSRWHRLATAEGGAND